MSHLDHLPAAGAIMLPPGMRLRTQRNRRDGMETLRFILANLPAIGQRTVEHVSIVGVAVSLAILTGVPIGIAITQNKRAADIVLYIAAMIMTIPSIALFGVMIPGAVADRAGHRLRAGGDRRPAVFAAADHPQHVHGDQQHRPGVARGGARHGHVVARSGCGRSRFRSRCR